MINCDCPHCNYSYQVEDSYAGETVKCPSCSKLMEIPRTPAPGKKDDPFSFANQGEGFAQRRAREIREEGGSGGGGGESNPVVGWLIFLLIFGVGNIILYSTTGMLIIPIRR